MKKLIAALTIALFLMGPTFLSAQGTQGYESGGQQVSAKAKKVEKKGTRSKKATKKNLKKKTKKLNKELKPMRDVETVPKSRQ